MDRNEEMNRPDSKESEQNGELKANLLKEELFTSIFQRDHHFVEEFFN